MISLWTPCPVTTFQFKAGKARAISRSICSMVMVILSIAGSCPAAQPSIALPNAPKNQRKPSNYCGIYCLYLLLKTRGADVDFQELVKPEYIGSRAGSSLVELKKAAEDQGMCGEIVDNLTSRQLRTSPWEIILHVKADPNRKPYDHYQLLLGAEAGLARLVDPPQATKLVPFRDLAPLWDGRGLIVSAEPINLDIIFAPARRRVYMYGTIIAAIILSVHWVRRRWLGPVSSSRPKMLGLSAAQGIGFALVALLGGMVYHFANDEGLLANANGTASIQEAHLANFIPKVNLMKLRRLLKRDAVIIDARFARDYEKGYMDGAVSIPVDANDTERQEVAADLAKDARVVVYCQSAGCKFAERVATKLLKDGFSNVSIFKGGWQEWVADSNNQRKNRL